MPARSESFEPKPRRGFDKPEVGKLFDRLPPHNEDAERSLLGAILLDPRVLTEVVQLVHLPEQFYVEKHGAIFKALLDTYEAHQSGDLVQLAEALRGRGLLERVGGPDYLVELAEAVPSAASAPHYARIVMDSARLRRLIDAAGQILHDAYTEGQAAPDAARRVIDEAEKRIFDIAQEEVGGQTESLHELLMAELQRIGDADGATITGIGTGYEDLDKMTSGLQPGEMLILAARPSMGKTAFALNLAEQIAFGGRTPWSPPGKWRPVPVGVFSLEMSRQSLAQRLLSSRSGVNSHKMRTGSVNASEWEDLTRATDELRDAPIHIDDTPGLTILQLRARARRMVQRHNVACMVIDYLQLLSSPGSARESRQVEVSEISRSIKALARELKIPVVCLAQLNRGAEQREGNRPKMSDLRESGSIEQDADVVMLLHRESYYHRGDEAWEMENADKLNAAELIIAKQRNGPTGLVKFVVGRPDHAVQEPRQDARGRVGARGPVRGEAGHAVARAASGMRAYGWRAGRR
ncbi:MAG: replicative DNA helicase [Phycisphaerales bacterium]